MKIQLICSECGYEEMGTSTGTLMNKIKMWNHLKRAHPMLAERMLKAHDMLPSTFFRTTGAGGRSRTVLRDVRPRFAS